MSTTPSRGPSVNHLVLNVRDIEASHRFYTELLGFEQCAELSHTMTMRFYRGSDSTHHDLALCEVSEPATGSTTSPSPTPTVSRGWRSSTTSRRTVSSSSSGATTA
jgi:catechol 2,3-dioxygenase-like lactoylglutathione lyase family enzyme